MNPSRALVAVLLLADAAWTRTARPPAIPVEARQTAVALRDKALGGTPALATVKSLCFEAGPRSAGSRGDKAAVLWALRTMKAAGLDNVHAEPVTVPHWERGAISGEIVHPWPRVVVLAALGGSIGTPEEGLEAEVVVVPTLEAVDQLDAAAVKGKIVFYNLRMERARDGAGYGKTVPIRGDGAVRAAKKGAVAVLIRSVGTDSNRLPHTGAMHYDETTPKIPAAALSVPDADLLEAELASGESVRFRLKLAARILPDAESANVVGELRGRERPDEVVILGAHLDSWDLGLGAIDDGAGCAIIIETARLIASLPQKPRRTLRVVLFANEEWGLSGGKNYAKLHEAELGKHVLAMESDLGTGRIWRLQSHVAPEALATVDELMELLKPFQLERGSNEGHGGADISPLSAVGCVPELALSQDASSYFDYHHTANDTPDKIDAKAMDQNVAVFAALAYAVAEMPGDLGRAPEEKTEAKKP